MLECIKFGGKKIRTIQIGDDCFVSVKKIGELLEMTRANFKALYSVPEGDRRDNIYSIYELREPVVHNMCAL